MGIIANDSIKIEGISEKYDLRDLFIEVKPNEHGKAYLSIRVKDEGQPANVVSSVKDKLITIKSTEADNSGVLFKGYVTFCDMNSVKSSGVVNLELISTSIKMDQYKGEKLPDFLIPLNQLLRGDQFKAENSFNASVPAELRADLVAVNLNSSCMLGETLDGSITSNDKYVARLNEEEVAMRERLKAERAKVPDLTENTVMQKVIDEGTFKGYLAGDYNTVGKCVARAEDSAPFTNNPGEVYENLRLDFKGSDYGNVAADTAGKVYVVRFTSPKSTSYNNDNLPNATNDNIPPCTETGFTGSDNCLIPEYYFGYSEISNGAIYVIDQDGNEKMAAYYDERKEKFIEL